MRMIVVVDEGSEVHDMTQPCSDALFVNSTLYPSLFVGLYSPFSLHYSNYMH